ncbi:hypothetical protein N7457_004718 [Penicillium paradoxum]|uniref:uncharacterized protein n=1 Tax=Penicillium paradoxum TaxID=176176 RepID=UPI00254879AA|nr:uncharacterized protein N7457_004718 [Penicillium paradoxum]KAJ5782944.1 hypothetical protein N7457_004718 [Penicillium paradoxum]
MPWTRCIAPTTAIRLLLISAVFAEKYRSGVLQKYGTTSHLWIHPFQTHRLNDIWAFGKVLTGICLERWRLLRCQISKADC